MTPEPRAGFDPDELAPYEIAEQLTNGHTPAPAMGGPLTELGLARRYVALGRVDTGTHPKSGAG